MGPREQHVCQGAKHVEHSSAKAADNCKKPPDNKSNPGP